MSSQKPKRSHQIQLITAGVLSIIAQGLLILPASLKSYLPVPDWGSMAIGVVLFAIATIWIVSTIRPLNAGWRGNAHFILNQAIIVIGIFLLSDSSASLTRLGGFILTSLITALTIYGIIANTSSPSLTSVVEVSAKEKEKETLRLLDLMQNADVLKEQTALANQKLIAEKQRTSQLTYLVELSHQLNAELEVKALVNMVMNINTAGLAEGLGLGAALGLELTMLREVFSQTGANSRVLQTDGEDMQNREHSCFFSAAHAAKDSGIAHKLGKQQGLYLPLAAATKKQYDRMDQLGLGTLDKSGIAELTFKGRGPAPGEPSAANAL